MAKTTKEIPIFFAVDDGYSPFLAVAIQSLIDNASAEYTYLIKILNTDISEENKRKIGKYERALYQGLLFQDNLFQAVFAESVSPV